MQKTCPQCVNSFEAAQSDKVYCSRLCKDRARRFRQGMKPLVRRSWKTGDRFGRLILIEYKPRKDGRQVWLCDCDCGTKGFGARADKLKSKRQQSCGCLHKEHNQKTHDLRLKQKEEQDAVRLFEFAETNAKRAERRKIESVAWADKKHKFLTRYLSRIEAPQTDPLWKISYYAEIIKDGCIYCRGMLESKGGSLGEINPTESFNASNVVPECSSCRDRNLWNDIFTFEERALLGQTIELIRLKRMQNNFPLLVSRNDL